MRPARLVTKGLDQLLQRKGLVDDRLHVIGINRADHLDLLPAVAVNLSPDQHRDGQVMDPFGLILEDP